VLDVTASLDPSGWVLLAVAPIIGSFLGVLIQRLPEGKPVVWVRSECEHCGAVLRARDLLPFASWLALRGRCRSCGQRLGWFYPAVEGAALLVAAIALIFDTGIAAWLDAALGWCLLTLGWIDLRRWVLPDVLTLPLLLAGLAAALWGLGEMAGDWSAELLDRAAGAACGYLGLQAVAWIYRRLRGREGLGGGDAKLLAAGGAWVGVSGLPTVLFGGASTALAVAGILMLAGHRLQHDTALPFGPFLAFAIWLVWLFGPLAIGSPLVEIG
jgi:leader peptidase (prepilin peptidase)/N-methyltransferase